MVFHPFRAKHFITLVPIQNEEDGDVVLWELDGKREAPVSRGTVDNPPRKFDKQMLKVANDPNIHFNFSVLTLLRAS